MAKGKGELEHISIRVADNGGYILNYSMNYPTAKRSESGWENKDEVFTTKEELAGRIIGLVSEFVDEK